MQLPGPLLSPSSKKQKKSTPKKNSYISGNGTFLPPSPSNKNKQKTNKQTKKKKKNKAKINIKLFKNF